MEKEVALREFFERLIEEHDKTHAAEHKAVKLQAKEYSRRLEALNHAHEQSVDDRNRFLERSRYDADIENLEQVNEEKNQRLAEGALAYFSKNQELIRALETAFYDFKNEAVATRSTFVKKESYDSDIDAREAAIIARLIPLERLASRAILLFAGSTFVGGLAGYIIQKALSN